jgi:hypothetical protein
MSDITIRDETIKNFLSTMNKRYGYTLAYKMFVREYIGNIFDDEDMYIEEPMPRAVKRYFKLFITDIKNMAQKERCLLYMADENELTGEEQVEKSDLPKSIREFQKETGCNSEIITGLFMIAAHGKNLASMRVRETEGLEGTKEYVSRYHLLTANYSEVKEYLHNELIELMLLYNADSIVKLVDNGRMSFISVSDLGQAMSIRYIAELHDKDLDFYKSAILEKAIELRENNEQYKDVSYIKIIYQMLSGLVKDDKEANKLGKYYMCIKYEIIRCGNQDFDDIAFKEARKLSMII